MDKVTAPWTDEQVARLWERQRHGHAYTCPTHSDFPLSPKEDGWHCFATHCGYFQDWAHAADVEAAQGAAAPPIRWPMAGPAPTGTRLPNLDDEAQRAAAPPEHKSSLRNYYPSQKHGQFDATSKDESLHDAKCPCLTEHNSALRKRIHSALLGFMEPHGLGTDKLDYTRPAGIHADDADDAQMLMDRVERLIKDERDAVLDEVGRRLQDESPCRCHEAYTSRGLEAPDCQTHDVERLIEDIRHGK